MLYGWFNRFVKHFQNPEQAQQAWGTYCIIALAIPTLLAFWNYFGNRSSAQSGIGKLLCSRPALFASIGACLIVCRFPVLLANEISPDETFFIAAAEKLFRDPIFFRAVDFVTSGPLNVYPLMLPAAVGISPDYVSTRLIALLIIFASIYVIYRTLALLTHDAAARIAILPAAGAFAVLKSKDFLHCSSEHVSFLLLALAFYISVRTFCRPQPHTWNIVGLGLLTACAFLAKMQAVPILACIAAIVIAYVHGSGQARRWWRPALLFGVGLAPLLLLNAIVCAWAGVWHDFWMEYIIGNYYYVDPHGTLTPEVQNFVDFALGITEIRVLVVSMLAILAAYVYQRTRREAVAGQALFLQIALVGGIVAVAANWVLRSAGGAVVSYAVMIAILILPGSFVLLCWKSEWSGGPLRWFGFLAAAVLAAAACVAYVPHRMYGHYLLLLVFPICIAMAWTVVAASESTEPLVGGELDGLAQRRDGRVSFLLVFAAVTLAGQLFQLGSPDMLAFAAVTPTVHAPESEIIDTLVRPDEQITVWGWNAKPYVGAGRVSALKDLFSGQLFLTSGEVRAYYRAGYLSGLQRYRPELFIDAVDTSHGSSANRKGYAFELLPEINAFIQSSYVHVLDAYGQRFYIRRDLARTVAGIGEPRKCDATAIRCFEAGGGAWIPADLSPVQLPAHYVIEAIFTPEWRQEHLATVFSNENSPMHQGFQFLHMENGLYRLGVGWGPEGGLSKELLLPQRKPVYLSIEFNGDVVSIVCNGVKRDEMHLPSPMQDSPRPITVGSGIEHQRPFLGNIQFFQIRSLGQRR
jgi:pimeloyl-ACP methyl ester carboxylesterase